MNTKTKIFEILASPIQRRPKGLYIMIKEDLFQEYRLSQELKTTTMKFTIVTKKLLIISTDA